MGYTVKTTTDMVALGVSAIGNVQGAFVQNTKKLPEYYAAVASGRFPIDRGYALDQDDEIRRHVITELMCNFRLDVPAVERRFGDQLRRVFPRRARRADRAGRFPGRGWTGLGAAANASTFIRSAGCSSATSAWCSTSTWRDAPADRSRCSAARYDADARRRRRRRHDRPRRGLYAAAGGGAGAASPIELTVLDAADEPGGHARTIVEDGFVIERGPNGFLDRGAETMALIGELKLGDRGRRSERASQSGVSS